MRLFSLLNRGRSNQPADYLDVREKHYVRHFGELTEDVVHWLDADPLHIDIYRFRPCPGRRYWTLVTGGMSDQAQYVDADGETAAFRTELMLYAKEPRDWMYRALKAMADFPFLSGQSLHWYHTFNNCASITSEPSELTGMICLPPVLEAPDFGSLCIGEERVDFLWVVPITDREREYAEENGSEALEDVFMNANVEPAIDERRKSVI